MKVDLKTTICKNNLLQLGMILKAVDAVSQGKGSLQYGGVELPAVAKA
jgi:hypothetical protein